MSNAKRSPASTAGIRKRHSRTCRTAKDAAATCNCSPTYEAWVYLKREGKKLRKTFASHDAARMWRAEAASAASRNALRTPTPDTLRQAWDEWFAGAKAGTIPNRNRKRFKPGTLRAYALAMNKRVLDEFGDRRLADITRLDVQEFADGLAAGGLQPSTVHNTLDPLRVVCARAVRRNRIAIDPTDGLDLLRADGRRECTATPAEVDALLAALPDEYRALWSTAAYAGLRRGELRALRWVDVDLSARKIRVSRGWDDREGEIEAKSDAGRRTVPIPDDLAVELAEHKLRTGRGGDDLVFGRSATVPFQPTTVDRRALAAWGWRNDRTAGKRVTTRDDASAPVVTLHQLRHHFASTMIAAGVNHKALQTIMGHTSITMTLDRYGHLFRGSEDEVRHLANAYHAQRRGERPALAAV